MSDEVSPAETPRKPPHKGIYLLPNLFTTAALFSGFYSIIASIQGHFESAAIAVFVAMVMDGLDGRVARLTNTSSAFGAEYDSLADMVSFGVAPALLMYVWALQHMANLGWVPAKLGWLAAFIYTAGAALRLARFNVQIGSVDKRYFVGLPSPSAAAVTVGLVWACNEFAIAGASVVWPALIVTVTSGLLMVSNILYHSFKQVDMRGRIPFMAVLVMVLVFALAALKPPLMLFLAFLSYAASGPVLWIWRRRQRSLRRQQS